MNNLGNFVKRIRDIMRNDAGINGDAQRIEQIAWMLFLKVYDSKEKDWDIDEKYYKSIIPEDCRWRNWAVDDKSGKAMTGERLMNFINNTLFPTLKGLTITPETPIKKSIVRTTFEDANNYMKDGVLLRQVINIIDELDLSDYEESHAFGDIYESILRELQSAGSAGEFYTPRAVTDFMAKMIQPQIGERMADFACGTGGFITSWLKELAPSIKTTEDQIEYDKSIFGIEKKQFPYMLCITNILLHGLDIPKIFHDNSLLRDVLDYTEDDQFDVILMNPPYGGNEKADIKKHFPSDLASSETADLFMSVIMYRLKKCGRAAVIIPDGFLSGTDNIKKAIKRKLLGEYNLHTVIRMPHSVFSPYTDITTNILFFDRTHPTKGIWYYRLDIPNEYKHFSKTKPMTKAHFCPVIEWWNNREEIKDSKEDASLTDTWKSLFVPVDDVVLNNYDLNYCQYPYKERIILSPDETLSNYVTRREELESQIDIATNAFHEYLSGNNSIQLSNINEIALELGQLNSEFPLEMKNSLLQAAVKGQLVEQIMTDVPPKLEGIDESIIEPPFSVPDSWKWANLSKLCTYLQRGKSPKYSSIEKIPVVSQKCIQWDGFHHERAQFIDPNTLSTYSEERFLRDEDLLINSTGLGTLGRAALYPAEHNQYELAVADSHVTVIRLKQNLILPRFLYAYWASPSIQFVIESQSSGTTKQKELGLKTLKDYLVPVPPIAEQRRIVEKLQNLLPLCEKSK
ncbi:N-6 DNA methylase [Youngiibacter multivorans]|uniref:site-specific DNA-methyltransferase (adenine-specific) n=1 Tax=Youngiibacter multivorans TaxID=937251 RepID=A0ABS4G6W7_9CLOT|nr:N-6 DNA methylase [Youngiibacter multivorans]MBP1920284.1 type I restriction-modification system DNA methylase subunit [Youngiibacter multivorans]